jgi:predicted PurR-regulated permease PerM
VDFALLWGILAWFLGYIPSIGFWLALIPPVILAWAQYGVTTALIVFAGYVLINGSVQNILQPRMMGERLQISPVVVFVSLFVWGWLLGGIGAILAVPLTMMILIVLDSFDGTRWLVVLVRFSPGHTEGERREALGRVQGMWDWVKKRSGLRTEQVEDGA